MSIVYLEATKEQTTEQQKERQQMNDNTKKILNTLEFTENHYSQGNYQISYRALRQTIIDILEENQIINVKYIGKITEGLVQIKIHN